MKIRFCAALLFAALITSVFAGCAATAVQPPADTLRETARSEQIITDTIAPLAPAPGTVPTTAPTQPASADPVLISKEEAIDIALKDAGLTRDQVKLLRSEFDYDNGRPEYEVDFHHGGYEYDYEIHAKTGEILSRDKDPED